MITHYSMSATGEPVIVYLDMTYYNIVLNSKPFLWKEFRLNYELKN